jgi:formate hydrogenlyase subunit 6/NADH:ubiquinone oxidoreductase subunit I
MAKLRVPELFKKAAEYIIIKPATSRYPFEKPLLPETFRGQPLFNSSLCAGCGTCSRNCPSKAIEMVEVGERKYPQLNLGKCIFCDQCVDICPQKAVSHSNIFELTTTDKAALIVKPQVTVAVLE